MCVSQGTASTLMAQTNCLVECPCARHVSCEWEIWLTTCMYMCTCLLYVLYILCNTPVNIIRTQYTHCTKMNFVQGRLILSYTYKHTVQHNVHVVVSQN